MQQNDILISDYQPNQRYLRASLIGTRTEWRFSGNTQMQQISTDLIPEYLDRDV